MLINTDPPPSAKVCVSFIESFLEDPSLASSPIPVAGAHPQKIAYTSGLCALMAQATLGTPRTVDFADGRLREFLRYIAEYGFSYSEVWQGVRYKFVGCES